MLKGKGRRNIFLLVLMVITSFMLVACRSESRTILDDEDLVHNLESSLDMSKEDLLKSKGKSKENYNKDKLMSYSYEESILGIEDIELEYYFDDSGEKVAGINIYFPKGINMEDLVKYIINKLGDPKLDEKYGEYNDRYLEWENENKVYYGLNNFKKIEDGDLLELNIMKIK